MMHDLVGPAHPIGSVPHPPLGAAGQRNVEFLGDVVMVGIFDPRPEDQEAGRNRVVVEMPARAEQLDPAVVVDEMLAEIGGCVGLPPAELVPVPGKQCRQRSRCAGRKVNGAVEKLEPGMAFGSSALAGIAQSMSARKS